MTNNDAPAQLDLPEKLRVHALAKLIGRTSKEVVAALGDLGIEVKSAQSSIDRKAAEQVVTALLGASGSPDTDAEQPVAEAASTADAAVADPGTDPAVADPGTPAEAAPKARRSRARRTRAATPGAETAGTGTSGTGTSGAGTSDTGASDPESSRAGLSGLASSGTGTSDAGTADTRAEVAGSAGVTAEPADAASDAEARAALSPIFAPPAPIFQAPERPTRRRRAAAPAADAASDEPGQPDAAPAEETATPSRRRRRGRAADAAEQAVPAEDDAPTAEDDEEAPAGEGGGDDEAGDDEAGDASRRRRRRGRRGRGRGRGGEDDADDNGDGPDEQAESAEDGEDDGDDTEEGDDGGSRRRRRRRRRRSGDADSTDTGSDDDPPGTVTRIRAPREARDEEGDGVQSVRGSTRLEAKRQRRRDGRDAGRRRQPILSESEFLARRESVARTMVVRERGGRIEIGVLEDDVLVEHFVAGREGGSLVGNVYLGRVQNVLPSMEAAFVDIGRGRNAVLYAGEVDWDAAGLGGKARRIEQALSSGDPVLVQVTKDPIGHKGARLTTQISLAGRFLVYVPSGGAAGISRKLPDVERRRLKDMLKEIVPSEAGVIIRTASEGVSHEALERDVRRLQAQWEVVKGKAEATGPAKPKAPVLLYEEPDLLIKVVRDQFNEDFSKLVVQGADAWDTLHGYISHVAPELADRMHRHIGNEDVFTAHRIDEQLLKALDRKVWLPSGGTLVIDRTEAMTVVDVNTGKFTGSGGNLEETVTRNNLEAAEEIVRQLRLRDIGGIIVIDFIDMVLEANRDLVLRRLTECLARDRTRHQVAEVTSLGLVQMTRKRVGGGLLEHFSQPCEHCRGRGVIVDVDLPAESHDHGRSGGSGDGRGDGNGNGRRSRGGRGRRGDHDGASNGNGSGGNGHAAHGSGDRNGHASAIPAPPPVGGPAAVTVADAGPAAVDAGFAALDTGAPTPAPAPTGAVEAGAAAAADAVEEAVVERSAGHVTPSRGAVPAPPAPVATAPAAGAPAPEAPELSPAGARAPEAAALSPAGAPAPEAAAGAVPPPLSSGTAPMIAPAVDTAPEPAPRRKRGRVTRTAGAPTVVAGDAPVAAVVTVDPGTPVAEAVPAPAVAPQPEPVVATKPRRSRRAASRPAGPPADGGGDPS